MDNNATEKVVARLTFDISAGQRALKQLSDEYKQFNESLLGGGSSNNPLKQMTQDISEFKKQLNGNTNQTFIENTKGQLVTLRDAIKQTQLSFKEGELSVDSYLKALEGLRKTYSGDFAGPTSLKNDMLLRSSIVQAQKEISSLHDFELESERKLGQQQVRIQAENLAREEKAQADSINNQIRRIREFYNMKLEDAGYSLERIQALLNKEAAYFKENEAKKLEAMKLEYKLRSDLISQQMRENELAMRRPVLGGQGVVASGLSKTNPGISTGNMIAGMLGFSAVMGMYETMVEGMKQVEDGAAGLHQVFEEQIHSEEQLNGITNQFLGIAQKYGTSIKDVNEAGKLVGRTYKDVNEALTVTNASTLLAVVDNVHLNTSVRGLEATMNAMGLAAHSQSEAFANSMRIVDSWSALAHKAAVSATDLVEATERAAGAAHVAGVNFDQLQALITSGVKNTGLAGGDIGNMLKSLFASIRTEGSQKALNDLHVSLTKVGQGGKTEFRPIFDVLLELSSKIQTADKSQQKMLETISGGKDQYSKVASMLSDYNTIIDAYAVSINSAGAAQTYAQVQMHTFSRDLERLKNTFVQLTAQTSQNGLGAFLKGMVEGITSLILGLQQLPPWVGQAALVFTGFMVGLQTFIGVSTKIASVIQGMALFYQRLTSTITANTIAQGAQTAASTAATIGLEAEAAAARTAATAFTALDIVSGGLAIVLGAVITGVTMYAMSTGEATQATQDHTQALQDKIGLAQQDFNLAQQKQQFMKTAIEQEQQLKKALEDTSLSAENRNKITNNMIDLYHAVGKATGDEALQQVNASNLKNHSLSTEQKAIATLVKQKEAAYQLAIEANQKEVKSDIDRTNQIIKDTNAIIKALQSEIEAKATELSFWDNVKVGALKTVGVIDGLFGGGLIGDSAKNNPFFNEAHQIQKDAHDKMLADAKQKLTGLQSQLAQDQYKLASMKLDKFQLDASNMPGDIVDTKPVDAGWGSGGSKKKKSGSGSNEQTLEELLKETARKMGLGDPTSGYRTPAQNKAVGGSATSFHLQGTAFDFARTKEEMQKFADWAKTLKQQGILKEVLYKTPNHFDHVHVGWADKAYGTVEGTPNSIAHEATKFVDGSKSTKKTNYITGPYAYEINSAAEQYSIDPDLVRAVAMQESSLGKTSKNVMKVNGMENASPAASINKGTQMLSELLKRTNGNEKAALAAYNMGPKILDFFDSHGGYSVENMHVFRAQMMKDPRYKKGYGDPDYVNHVLRYKTGSGGGTSDSEAAKDFAAPYKDSITNINNHLDPYLAINKQLDGVLSELTRKQQTYGDMLKHGASDTKIAGEETNIYQQKIQTLKLHQDSLHGTNNQIRSDMEKIKKQMTELNPGSGDVSNLSQGQQDALQALSQEYDKLSQQADQNSQKWGEHQKEITQTTLDWLDAIYQLHDNGLQPLANQMHQNDNDMKLLQTQMGLYSDQLKHNANDVAALRNYMKAYHEEVTELADQNRLLSETNDQIRADNDDLRTKLTTVDALYKAGKITLDAYQASVQSLNTHIQKNSDALAQNTNQQIQNTLAQQAETDKIHEMIVSNLRKGYEQEQQTMEKTLTDAYKTKKDLLEKEKKDAKDASDAQIKSLEDQKNAIDDQIKALERQWQAQDDVNKLSDLQKELSNVMSQKDHEIIGTDGKLTYTHDVQKANDIQKQISDEQTRIARNAQKQQLEDQKASIDKQIQNLRDQEQQVQDSYDKQLQTVTDTYNKEKDQLSEYWKYRLEQDQLNQEADNLILKQGTDTALETVQTFANQMIDKYNSITAAARAAAAAMAQSMGASSAGGSSGGGGSGGGSGSSSGSSSTPRPTTHPTSSVETGRSGTYTPGGGFIPKFATGARFTSPTLAMVGEGGEPETLIPDSKLTALLSPGNFARLPGITMPTFTDFSRMQMPVNKTVHQSVQISKLEFPNVRTASDAQGLTTEIARLGEMWFHAEAQ